MATFGKRNSLTVLRAVRPGFYLNGENLGDILLPHNEAPRDIQIGAKVDVFLYCDSDDRLIATAKEPRAQVGDFACLQVVSVDERLGAFLDWGLPKDVLLPNREQERRLRAGDWVVVHIHVDELSGRIIASAKLGRYLSREEPTYRKGEKVSLLIIAPHDLGYTAIVENSHRGLLYHSDLGVRLYLGQKLDGYVKQVREDGKIDLSLDPAGYSRVAPLSDKILAELQAKGGRLPFDDSSTPEEIRSAFGVSKKSFKQAIGALFKERKIVLLERGIALPFDPPDKR